MNKKNEIKQLDVINTLIDNVTITIGTVSMLVERVVALEKNTNGINNNVTETIDTLKMLIERVLSLESEVEKLKKNKDKK
jgi:uncharacterized protein (UPF0335 family)